MAFDLQSITTGRTQRPPRVLLLGTQKIGKSTFAAEAPGVIFLPIKGEEGIDDMDCAKFPPAETWDDVKAAVGSLINDDHDYTSFAIDSSSALEPIIWAEVCKRHSVDSIEKVLKGFGKGFTEAVILWTELCDGLDILRNEKNMSIFLIGHVTTGSFNDPMTDNYDQYRWDVQKKAAACMERWADAILFINTKVYTKSEEGGFGATTNKASSTGGRFLYTDSRPTHPGGGRGIHGKLPYEIPIEFGSSYQAWVDAINKAMEK